MSLPLEMLDNIGHWGSPTEHEVDNSYKLSRIRREHELGSQNKFVQWRTV